MSKYLFCHLIPCTFASSFSGGDAMKNQPYFWAAFVAFFIWGFFSLALKPIAHYPSLDILFFRVFMSVGMLSLINLGMRRKKGQKDMADFKALPARDKKQTISLTVVGALLLAANWLVFIYVMNHVSVNAAAFAYLVCPILTTVFAYAFLKEKLSRIQWLAVSSSAFACVLLSFGHIMEVVYSLVVAATYALYLVSQRKNNKADKLWSLNIQLVIVALLLAPFFPILSGPIPTEHIFYICLSFIVVIFTIIPLFLNLYALKGVNSATVGILIYINPIINFLLAITYFKEEVTSLQLAGYGLILFSIVLKR